MGQGRAGQGRGRGKGRGRGRGRDRARAGQVQEGRCRGGTSQKTLILPNPETP